ncbi:MAG: WecB/TagA/CpsF family glycosyltransferase [bacterium]
MKIKNAVIFSIKVSIITQNELHSFISYSIKNNLKSLVLNVNINCLNLAYTRPWLKDFLNLAPVVFVDGAGVMWGMRVLGHKIPERITYADWLLDLSGFCEEQDFSLYFLGAKPGIAQKAAEKLRRMYPNLRITGIDHGYFNLEGKESREIIEKINKKRPDILVTGFGMPRQEKWLSRNWEEIDAKIFLTGGACFDFVSGTMPRCPRFMADHSMEWLFRLFVEPRRMFKRYVLGNPLFVWRVFKERFSGRQ